SPFPTSGTSPPVAESLSASSCIFLHSRGGPLYSPSIRPDRSVWTGRSRPRFEGEDVQIRRKSFLALGGLAASVTMLAACGGESRAGTEEGGGSEGGGA